MTKDGQSTSICAIIPAAGLSRRMGVAKQTLPYRGTTITGQVARTLLDAGVHTVIVVTRSELIEGMDLPQDRRLRIAINDDSESEMIDSIRIGLQAAFGPDKYGTNEKVATGGILAVPGDMPKLSADSCRKCIDAFVADQRRIVIASNGGKRGHPMIFPASMIGTINDLRHGLRELTERFSSLVTLAEVKDSGATHDVDTPRDYESL